jgi:hypothetical protein
MRKLAITLAAALVMVLGGLLVWKADATTLSGSHSMPPLTNNFSPVEKVGCRGPGRCPYGLRWVCGPYRCWCAPCGYYGPRRYWRY